MVEVQTQQEEDVNEDMAALDILMGDDISAADQLAAWAMEAMADHGFELRQLVEGMIVQIECT